MSKKVKEITEESSEEKPVNTILYLLLMRLKAITAELAMIHDTLVELEYRDLSIKLRIAFGVLKSALGDLEELVDIETIQDEIIKAIEEAKRRYSNEGGKS
ncbi:MAG: hypothetical protein DRN15_07295 [Thermoprotei archaeon]|nr:MAG: hypothetical protein DRN15_07295 [Thermoprotei archaeon]